MTIANAASPSVDYNGRPDLVVMKQVFPIEIVIHLYVLFPAHELFVLMCNIYIAYILLDML